MIISRRQNSGQNQNVRIANESFENMQMLENDTNKSESHSL